MQLILILLSQDWCILVGTCCNRTWLSNELILAVSGVTAATARLPSLPVLTSSSPPFPFPAIDISSFSPFTVRAAWTRFSSFSDSQGRTEMDLTLNLLLIPLCSVLAAIMLDSRDPLFPQLVSQGQAHWLKLVVYLVGRFKVKEGLHFECWTWRQKNKHSV